MADPQEPKKETVHITVTAQPDWPPTKPVSRDTVRIHLPTRLPTNPFPPQAAEPPSPARAAAAAAMPAPMTTHAAKKETARITVAHHPPAKPAVEMKKKQPLIDLPAVETPVTRVTVAPTPQPVSRVDEIPMPLCWGLIAASAATLILQIWNYLS